MTPLRSTRGRCGRDAALFPMMAFMSSHARVPSYFTVRVGPSRVQIFLDGFFVPEDMSRRLEAIYRDYVDQWLARRNPARRRFPRGGVTMPRFRDAVYLTVLREHAPWWIDLLDCCAQLSYNPWGPNGDRRAIVQAERWASVVGLPTL